MGRKLQVILSHHAVLGLQAVELLGLGGKRGTLLCPEEPLPTSTLLFPSSSLPSE